MKNIDELMAYLYSLDMKLWVEGERLRYRISKESLTPTLRAELAERKTEIITFLRQANLATHSHLPPIQLVPRDEELSLSFAQQRLWFITQMEGKSAPYNEFFEVNIKGPLKVAVLAQSLTEIVKRHEILRTSFPTKDGRPFQVIAPTQAVLLPVVDLRSLPEPEQRNNVRQLAIEDIQRPFDLVTGPLLRVSLLRLPDIETDHGNLMSNHVMRLTIHHIIADGWSKGVIIRELSILYTAFSQDQPSPLSPLPIQYADFAHWQRQWLTGELLETQLNYWRQQLADVPALLELPTDRPRPPLQTFRGNSQLFEINQELKQQLTQLSQQSGTTLFMTLFAAFVTLLSRYSGQEDIVVGSPIANRNRHEIESLIGFFVNTLVLRTHLSGNPSFIDLLAQVKQVALDAYAHQDVPFEQLVEVLQPERNLSHSPFFQVIFILQNAPMANLELPGLSLSINETEYATAKFDLTLSLEETAQGIKGQIEYNTDLFDATTITRMMGHFQTLLEGIVTHPEQRLSELPLLTEAERHQLLVKWNDTATDYPAEQCIHQLFEAQVEKTPDAVAVVFENQQLTYQALNARANQLAHYLQTLGVKPETLVSICLERSLEMVIGLLGILKAGGAYLPLDPVYPSARLAFMLEDAGVPVLLTQSSLTEGLPNTTAQVVCLDVEAEALSQLSAVNLRSGVEPTNLAYVIYTSGSTGKPKGVAVPHQAVNRLVFNTNYIQLESSDRIAQVSNVSFDAATFEIWGALLHGARLVGIAKDIALSPHEFTTSLRDQEITVLFLTTALFNQLAREVPLIFNQMRYILFGGEAVEPRWVSKILQHGPPQRLLHVYGPTENTTFSSWYLVKNVPEGAITIPIGGPISNTQLFVLDKHLQPTPIGVLGELHVGGAGLARGYLNRPDLTQEKFIPNPFSADSEARLYKTGDLVRYLPDGNIEYLSRVDNQVKIRGFRIELGEIEAVLAQFPSVRENVVIVHEVSQTDKRLVACIVANEGQVIDNTELRDFLTERLPNYMVPSTFVNLDTLPLTPNGKVDRRALSQLAMGSYQLSEKTFVAPRTPEEKQLADIWAELLKVERVGIHDNFFELGGHSLLVPQVVSRVRNTFSIGLPIPYLFKSPTVAGLAKHIKAIRYPHSSEMSKNECEFPILVPIQTQGLKRPLFCVVPGHGDIFALEGVSKHLGNDQPFFVIQAPYQDKKAPRPDVKELASRYLQEIRAIQNNGPYRLAGYCAGGTVAFEIAQQLQAQGQSIELLILLDTGFKISFWHKLFYKTALKAAPIFLPPRHENNSRNVRIFNNIFRDDGAVTHFLAACNYVPQPYQGRIVFVQGEESELKELGFPQQWEKVASGGLDFITVPGDHDSFVRSPNDQVLAQKLKDYLEQFEQQDNYRGEEE
ncbi:MAG TPA: amino acid adenylation domain-containing protein [Thioploca sp.]|nr:amino acid adenylation domain-containing protein [Thioploca sp.]